MLAITNAKYLYLQIGDTHAVVTTLYIILIYPKGFKSQAKPPRQRRIWTVYTGWSYISPSIWLMEYFGEEVSKSIVGICPSDLTGLGGLLPSAWSMMTSHLTSELGLMPFPLLGLLSSSPLPASLNSSSLPWNSIPTSGLLQVAHSI